MKTEVANNFSCALVSNFSASDMHAVEAKMDTSSNTERSQISPYQCILTPARRGSVISSSLGLLWLEKAYVNNTNQPAVSAVVRHEWLDMYLSWERRRRQDGNCNALDSDQGQNNDSFTYPTQRSDGALESGLPAMNNNASGEWSHIGTHS